MLLALEAGEVGPGIDKDELRATARRVLSKLEAKAKNSKN